MSSRSSPALAARRTARHHRRHDSTPVCRIRNQQRASRPAPSPPSARDSITARSSCRPPGAPLRLSLADPNSTPPTAMSRSGALSLVDISDRKEPRDAGHARQPPAPAASRSLSARPTVQRPACGATAGVVVASRCDTLPHRGHKQAQKDLSGNAAFPSRAAPSGRAAAASSHARLVPTRSRGRAARRSLREIHQDATPHGSPDASSSSLTVRTSVATSCRAASNWKAG